MALQIKKASKQAVHIKLCLTGASGSGKTLSALRMAKGLVNEEPLADDNKIAVIDTENNSASLYSTEFKFSCIDMVPPHRAENFVQAVSQVVDAGFEVVIIDSGSHLWEGVLDYKDQLDKGGVGRSGNSSFTNWNQAGAKFKEAINAILQAKIHVIVCLRSKQEYVLEPNDKGKMVPRRLGMAPVFRDGAEFEFTTILDITFNNTAVGTKDRTRLFPSDRIITPHITEKIGEEIRGWLTGAAEPQPAPQPAPQPSPQLVAEPVPSASQPAIDELQGLMSQIGLTDDLLFKRFGAKTWADISEDMARTAISGIKAKLEQANTAG